jgi:hypothetical protein
MSAEVRIILAEYADVLTIPVAAVVESAQGDFCWVKTVSGAERRSLKLGDTNNVFTIVEAGLAEGDEVVLNPLAYDEAQELAQTPPEVAEPSEPEPPASGKKAKPSGSGAGKPTVGKKKAKAETQAANPKQINSQLKKK